MNLNNNEIKSAIIGMVIGDASISKRGKGQGCMQMSHCERQFCYMLWKESIINKITGTSIRRTKRVLNGKEFFGFHLWSNVHPMLTSLFKRFYHNGCKVVDEYLVKMITPLALAIMFMDDGCFSKHRSSYSNSYFLCLQSFDFANQLLIKKSLKINFGLDWNINKAGNSKQGHPLYRLRLANRHNQQFVDIVKPYMKQIPCMLYKLGSHANISENSDIDIVRSS